MQKITQTLWVLSLLTMGTVAQAEWRCDCTTIVASCDAEVAVKGNWVEITTDQQACARVDYFIDGLPFVALAVDGSDRQDWISQTEQPNVMVQSCQVCADRLTEQPEGRDVQANGDPDMAAGETELTPLIQITPDYPDSAQGRGLEGYVVVEFKLSPFGTVEEPRVVEAKPSRIFDQAALTAIRRWRYAEDRDAAQPRVVKERLEFRISDYIWNEPTRGSRQITTANRPRAAGPRNECVREGVAYNFGEVVEVGLVNACVDPVVLFSCAVGTGGDQGRWRCAADDPSAILLVQPGDQRIGRTSSAYRSIVASTYAENHFLMRPPNTEYWWIACNEGDEQCHEAARDWSAQLNGRSATIDPAQVSRVRVARSY